jgi:hypothetical protein
MQPGQTATFTVAATGSAPLTYEWQKNGTAIAGATSSTYRTPATATTRNGALFTLVVTNSVGNVDQQRHHPQEAVMGKKTLPLLLLALGAVSAQAADYHVSVTGSDTRGTGTASNPWATILHASTVVAPGDTVHVASGTYTGSFTTTSSGTSASPITYISDTKWGAKLFGGSSGTVWSNNGDYIIIKNFDVSQPPTGTGLNGVYTQDVLTNGACNGRGGSGINLNGTNAQVVGNYVHNIGTYPTICHFIQGIYFLKAGGTAWNNIVFRIGSYGIQAWHSASKETFVNNTIFSNGDGCITIGSDDVGHVVDFDVAANNICDGSPNGIKEQGASSANTGIHNVYRNNLMFNNRTNFSLQNGLTSAGTITANPNFVNFTGDSSGDYHLQSTSPAVNAGTSDGAPTYDFDGTARPQGSAWDIGAYEYIFASTGTATLAPNALTFASQTIGTSSAAQTVTLSNGTSSLLTAGLTGTGSSSTTPPTVSLSPTSLTFAGQAMGTSGPTQFVTLTNTDNARLIFNGSFLVSGHFALAGTGTPAAVP